MKTFNLTRAQALELLQRDFKHILQHLDEEVPEQGSGGVEAYHGALLRATIRALERLDSRSAAMSMEGQHVGADPMGDYLNRFGPPR